MANHNVPGYVYLIYDPSAQLYKIGLSRTPATRLRYLKQSYGKLKILQVCWTVNMLFVEQWLHRQFKLVRIYRGSMDGGTEWFKFDWWAVPYVKMSLISKCWLVIVGYVLGGVFCEIQRYDEKKRKMRRDCKTIEPKDEINSGNHGFPKSKE